MDKLKEQQMKEIFKIFETFYYMVIRLNGGSNTIADKGKIAVELTRIYVQEYHM